MRKERKPLTKARIEKAVAGLKADKAAGNSPREITLGDSLCPGYRARCLWGGAVTLDYRYRERGGGRKVNQRPVKIGRWPGVSVEDGRTVARVHAGQVAVGNNPAEQKAEERRRIRATLSKLLAENGPFERHLKDRRLVNLKTALSSLRRGLKVHMATDVGELTRNDVVTAINALMGIGKRGAADDLRKFSRAFLEWAVEQGLAKFNVMAGLRAPSRTRHQRLQDAEDKGKALSDTEVVKVWRAAQAWQDRAARGESVAGSFGGLVQLALLTGCRRGELAQLERDRHILTGERAVDNRGITGERIHLPKDICKTAADHDVVLTPLVRAVIAAQPRTSSPLLFPSRITGGRLKGWSKLLPALQRDSGVDFAPHDLRRTTRTMMSKLGISEDIAELAIGHQRADLVARYNKDQAWSARVAAFEAISAHIRALLAQAADDSGNIIPMQAKPLPSSLKSR